jgi:hypothetical protein
MGKRSDKKGGINNALLTGNWPEAARERMFHLTKIWKALIVSNVGTYLNWGIVYPPQGVLFSNLSFSAVFDCSCPLLLPLQYVCQGIKKRTCSSVSA